MISLINFLLIAGVVQAFGFNLVTIFVKKKFSKPIIYLNLVVLSIALNNLQRWLIDKGYWSDQFLLENLMVPWYLFIVPMFYAFATHFMKIENKVVGYVKPTIIIFIIEIVIKLCLISYVYHVVPGREDSLIRQYLTIEDVFNLIYSIFIFINVSLLIFRKNKHLDYILNFDDLKWLKWFVKLGVFVVLFWAIAVVIKSFTGDESAYLLVRSSSSLILYWIGYQGFYKFNVVQDRIQLRNSIEADKVLIQNNSQTIHREIDDSLSNEKHLKEFEEIRNHIITNKQYLNPLLNQDTLTSDLGMSRSHFSMLVNTYSGNNFPDFINSLRVEQAKKFLSNDDFRNYTIVSIGLECGFNSKSTFYSAFKKFTSETPSSYRTQF